MKKLDEFMKEFDELLNKNDVKDIILINFDDNQMGYRQLVKIVEIEKGNCLVIGFSGEGRILCPCCAEEGCKKEK